MDLGLANKRVLITGGASGLGAELCKEFVGEGAKVVINYRSRAQEAADLVAELGAENALAVQADLAQPEQVAALFDQAVEAFGGLDILINNAGYWATVRIGEISRGVWDKTMEINLASALNLCQRFIVHCNEEGREGRILNVTSQAAFLGSTTGHIPYAASKAGLVSITRSLAKELGASKIRVNCIAIGMMESPMIAKALETKRELYTSRIPSGKIAQPEDIAPTAVFLCSAKASYLTGATVDVSGGLLRH